MLMMYLDAVWTWGYYLTMQLFLMGKSSAVIGTRFP